MAPLPVADARHSWSPEVMTTAPRLRTLLPDVTVQRASWRVASAAWGAAVMSVTSVASRSPRAPAGVGDASPAAGRTVVKWRSSRRRSSEPDFQIANSSESASAAAEAAMMLVSLPMVDQVRAPSIESMITRVLRGGRRDAVEDADLVVDQADVVEPRVERPERLAQGGVERVDRAVAVAGGVQDLAVDLDLDGRLGQELAAVALLDQAGVVDDPERRDVVGRVAPDEELEAGLGAFEREPVRLELLDQLGTARAGRRRLRARDRAARPGSRCWRARRARTRPAARRCRRRSGRCAGSSARPWRRPRRGRRPCGRTPTGRRTAGSRSGSRWRSRRSTATGRSARSGVRRRPGTSWCGVLSARLARMLTMLALPARSP